MKIKFNLLKISLRELVANPVNTPVIFDSMCLGLGGVFYVYAQAHTNSTRCEEQ